MHRRVWSSFFLAFVLSAGSVNVVEAEGPPAPVVVEVQDIDYSLSAQALTNLCDHELTVARRRIDTILARPSRRATFTNTVLALEDVTSDVGDRLVAAQFLGSVSSDRSIRDASDRCQDGASQVFSAVNTRPELARQLAVVGATVGSLSRADAKLFELWNDAVRRSGAYLPDAERAQVRALLKRIDELETAFSANLANATPTIELRPAQTTGLPIDASAGWSRTSTGNVLVPVSESTEERFLGHAADASAREAYFKVFHNRGYPENLPILRETLALRLRLAHLLGYPTWADYVLDDRMAKSPERVHRFLDDLDARLLPAARADIHRLALLKAADLHVARATIEPWDIEYYHAYHLRQDYAVDDGEVRRYFPVEHSIQAVLGIYAKLLGLRFRAVLPAHAWSPEVMEYAVYDSATGEFRGTLYFDLYPRPGKYTHFASFPLLPARRLADGRLRAPIDAIVGNWSRPAPGQPALLTHEDVQTFFHEFGHAMATILATTPYETLSAGFRTDFVEAPSQMLENWVWNPQILRELSSNVDTGVPMPDELIQKLIAARYVDEAYFTTRQILYADVDLAYHSADPGDDTTGRWRVLAQQVTPMALIPGGHPEAAFGHIMGGYDAGYYGYLWSKVYAQDLFTAFLADGLESPMIGARYRHDILEPARELEPDEEVRRFLGRPMSPAAFYRDFGLTVPVSESGHRP